MNTTITPEQVERITRLIAETAEFNREQADHVRLALEYELDKKKPDPVMVLFLTLEHKTWQALAHGARSIANAYDAQDRAAHGAAAASKGSNA
jgi:hypothetical protein